MVVVNGRGLVEVRRGRLRIAVEVTRDGDAVRARIVEVRTAKGEVMREPLDSETVADICFEVIEGTVERETAAGVACACGAKCVPRTRWCFTCNPAYPVAAQQLLNAK